MGTSKTDTLIVQNTGNATTQVQNVTTTNPEFTVSKTSFSLGANEADTIFCDLCTNNGQ
ncbi:MAG: hypothetical protein HC896_01055 [Bacteroidales bacterium]|nr:hypothetical protein [Bacteroidales bacterium]